MIIKAIAAGMMIALGAGISLEVGGILGSLFFSIGLLTILYFQFNLFTGKAGLLLTKQISILNLGYVWCGNFLGCLCGSILLLASGKLHLREAASVIVNIRLDNLWYENILLGVFCGLLMYIAVNYYSTAMWVTSACVAAFILLRTNHCVADMVYMFLGCNTTNILSMLCTVLLTTLGNIIGCNIIPFF